MLSRVFRTIAEHGMFAAPAPAPVASSGPTASAQVPAPALATRVLVAVSGGPDSMALLASLWELSARLGLALEVAFVDHALRPGSAREGELVAERASALGLAFHGLRVDVGAARAGRPGGGGVQEVARRLRLDALAALAAERGMGSIALGHNATDQAETVLFRILRGTGIEGLAGIPYRRGPFVRPLLDVARPEIMEYLRLRSLPFVEDPSNHDFRFTRARIRHRLLPFLRQENPRLDEALQRLAASAAGRLPTAAALGATIDDAPVERESAAGAPGQPGSRVGRAPLAIPGRIALPVAVAARAARGTRSFDLPGSRRIVVTYGQVRVIQQAEDEPQNAVAREDVEVPGVGTYAVGLGVGGGWSLRLRELGSGDLRTNLGADGGLEGLASCWFDGDRLAWPLSVRNRRPGDRMRPRGGIGSRKVADLMIDAKIPVSERAKLPVVVAADGELIYIAGLRPSEAGRPSEATRRWIELALKPGLPSPKERNGALGPT